MKTTRKFKLVIVIFIAMFLSNIAFAQPYLQEKRIYVVDVTGSMEGRGAVETPNIFNKVKQNLVSAIESIPTSSTEVVIIPFTNRPVGEFSGTIEHKDSLTSYISDLKIFGGDTNIADAWDRGISHIDTTKVNYIFLLTDGLHNCGPSPDALYQKLSKWGESTAGKYVFAFYVMLTPNAKDLEICKIIEGSRNIWLIESMNIDASLVKTSILLKKNVFHDGNTSISFDSTNPNIDLNDVGITVDIEDNQFYDISDLRSSEEVGTFSFNIIEKKEKREMPILDTIGLRISHNKEAYPFVFFTPDYIELIVANQGPRHISITDNIRKEKHLKPMNLGTIKFREPFRGIFESARPYMESSLEGPPFSWFMSDTSAITKNLYVTFNEEAIRSKSNISFELRNEQGLLIDNVQFQYGNEKCIAACDSTITVPLTYTILPGTESGTINGYLVANTSNIDFINDKETNSGKDSICDFSVTYKETGTWFLWLLWSLIIIVIVAIVLYGLYWIFKGLFIAIKWIVKGIWTIITLPFRAIGSLFAAIGAASTESAEVIAASMSHVPNSNGHWKGKVGNSMFMPDRDIIPKDKGYSNMDNKTFGQILDENGIKGIKYKNGNPDFKPVQCDSVKMNYSEFHDDLMKNQRKNLHNKAFEKLRDKWNNRGRRFSAEDVRTLLGETNPRFKDDPRSKFMLDMTSERDPKKIARAMNKNGVKWDDSLVKLYKEAKNLVWHEETDGTLRLLSREVHDNFPHSGGVSFYKKKFA